MAGTRDLRPGSGGAGPALGAPDQKDVAEGGPDPDRLHTTEYEILLPRARCRRARREERTAHQPPLHR